MGLHSLQDRHGYIESLSNTDQHKWWMEERKGLMFWGRGTYAGLLEEVMFSLRLE